MLAYAVTPAIAKSLYPVNDSHNTWNGPIVQADGKFHTYNFAREGPTLMGSSKMIHGIADRIEGPYDWSFCSVPGTDNNHNFQSVVFPDADGKPSYSLWMQGGPVYLADSPFGPFEPVNNSFAGVNPAPLYHQGAFYVTTQHTKYIQTASSLSGPWSRFAEIELNVTEGTGTEFGTREDPFMWIDKRGNWHIINHAYDTTQTEHCASSTLSSHLFSTDGKSWDILQPKVEPYGHTVEYHDGSSHTYSTLERPFIFFDKNGQMTHLALAADLVTGDQGCKTSDCYIKGEQGNCACVNCKYLDHAGSILVKLDVPSVEAFV